MSTRHSYELRSRSLAGASASQQTVDYATLLVPAPSNSALADRLSNLGYDVIRQPAPLSLRYQDREDEDDPRQGGSPIFIPPGTRAAHTFDHIYSLEIPPEFLDIIDNSMKSRYRIVQHHGPTSIREIFQYMSTVQGDDEATSSGPNIFWDLNQVYLGNRRVVNAPLSLHPPIGLYDTEAVESTWNLTRVQEFDIVTQFSHLDPGHQFGLYNRIHDEEEGLKPQAFYSKVINLLTGRPIEKSSLFYNRLLPIASTSNRECRCVKHGLDDDIRCRYVCEIQEGTESHANTSKLVLMDPGHTTTSITVRLPGLLQEGIEENGEEEQGENADEDEDEDEDDEDDNEDDDEDDDDDDNGEEEGADKDEEEGEEASKEYAEASLGESSLSQTNNVEDVSNDSSSFRLDYSGIIPRFKSANIDDVPASGLSEEMSELPNDNHPPPPPISEIGMTPHLPQPESSLKPDTDPISLFFCSMAPLAVYSEFYGLFEDTPPQPSPEPSMSTLSPEKLEEIRQIFSAGGLRLKEVIEDTIAQASLALEGSQWQPAQANYQQDDYSTASASAVVPSTPTSVSLNGLTTTLNNIISQPRAETRNPSTPSLRTLLALLPTQVTTHRGVQTESDASVQAQSQLALDAVLDVSPNNSAEYEPPINSAMSLSGHFQEASVQTDFDYPEAAVQTDDFNFYPAFQTDALDLIDGVDDDEYASNFENFYNALPDSVEREDEGTD
ncbi:hypothetical protein FRC03_004023 [Tulasnella sp. 419]|nr:hypothetical protein FRC03_004023 [Tulasnella sp. 419]